MKDLFLSQSSNFRWQKQKVLPKASFPGRLSENCCAAGYKKELERRSPKKPHKKMQRADQFYLLIFYPEIPGSWQK